MMNQKKIRASRRFHNQSGFTIVEVTIAMFLLSVVLAIGISFFVFGIASFNVSERQADIQQNARYLGEFISRELRMAERVIIIDKYDGEIKELDVSDFEGLNIEQPEPGFHVYFIFIDESDGLIYYQEVDGTDKPAILLEGISRNVDFDLNFKISEDKSNILQIDITVTDKLSDNSYLLETEVLVLNLSNIESNLIEGGTAIIYQVPMPYPSIRNIILDPQRHDTDGIGGQLVNVSIYTKDVTDGSEVTAAFYKVGDDATPIIVEHILPVSPSTDFKIIGNKSKLEIKLPAGTELYFGDYYVSIDVSSVPFGQNRFYYILPVIESVTVTPLPGKVREGTVEIMTVGVPSGTAAEKTLITNPEGDQLFVALVEKTGMTDNPFNFIDFEIQAFSTVDTSGKITFKIKINEADAHRDLFVTAKIGRLDWWVPEEFLNANAYLSGLSVSPGVLNPVFVHNVNSYEIEVGADVENVALTATLEDENATMKINGTAWDGSEKGIDLNASGEQTIITIVVTAEDGVTEETYTITVNRLAS